MTPSAPGLANLGTQVKSSGPKRCAEPLTACEATDSQYDTTSGTPINFAPVGSEPYELVGNDRVIVYRFADQTKPAMWRSPRRTLGSGDFTQPSNKALNQWALLQSSYGSEAENPACTPFISVATNHQTLKASNDPWVQRILQKTPTLGVFAVPFTSLFRPRPTKPISKAETEWLYYDGDQELTAYLKEWLPNPYAGTAPSASTT